jgi:hypothetical protein
MTDQAPEQDVEALAHRLRQQDPATYGVPGQGQTLANTWNVALAATDVPYFCVVAEGRSPGGTEGITTVLEVPAVALVRRVQAMLGDGSAMSAFVHDGRSGHAITLLGCAGDRIVYIDSWPGDSLLCLHQNAAGVDAQPFGQDFWSVSPDELTRVLVAVLAPPCAWAEASGRPGSVRVAELIHTGFWTDYGFYETGHKQTADLQRTARDRSITGYSAVQADDQVKLILWTVCLDDGVERIEKAELRLRTSWALPDDGVINLHGLDVARGLVAALCPRHDRPAAARAICGLDPAVFQTSDGDPDFQSTPAGKVLPAYLGHRPALTLIFTLSSVVLGHLDADWILLRMHTY